METDVKQIWWRWTRACLAVVLACLFFALVQRREGVIGVRAIIDAVLLLALIFAGIWKHGDFEPFGWVFLIVFLMVTAR
jgi:hypothetical protein